jgi:Zn-dependent M28 family amino/carboxypeptidase
VVFVAFSAEELGLLGSFHYVAYPARPMESTRFMLNLDMVGHLDTNGSGRTLTAYNAKSSSGLATFVSDIASRYATIRVDLRGTSGGSDHAPFAYRGVPVVFLHTGLTPTYHAVTDTAGTLDYPGIVTATAFGFETAWRASYTSDLGSLGHAAGMIGPSGLDHDSLPFVRLGP